MSILLKTAYAHDIDQTYDFYMTDSAELFEKNCVSLGTNWLWYNKKIEYKFNDLGYRMKNLSEVDLDNYSLFLGCSNCVGVGLAVEDTYAYKISKSLNMDYINAGVGGASVDFVYYNFIKLITSVKDKFPKNVIINWPEISRTFYWEDTNSVEDPSITFFGPNFTTPTINLTDYSVWIQAYKEFIQNNNHSISRFIFIRDSIIFMCSILGIEYYDFTTSIINYEGLTTLINGINIIPNEVNIDSMIFYGNIADPNDLKIYSINCARDLVISKNGMHYSHPGIHTNQQIHDSVVNFIRSRK